MNVAKIIKIVQIVLIGFIAFWVVRAVMVFFTPQSAWTPLPNGSVLQPAVKSALGATRGAIDINFDPFHRSIVAAAPANLGEDAPETNLDLTMVGRRASENGSAILRLPDGSQKGFRIEDEILSGVTLEAVNVDFIVIAQDGRLERLTFEKGERGLQPATKVSSSLLTPSQTSVNAPLNKKVPYLNARNIEIPRDSNPNGEAIADRATPTVPSSNRANANPLLAALNFTPQRVNNQVTGYKISPKQAGLDPSVFGLQAGDVITRIGSIGLQNDDVNFETVLSRLQDSRSTTVDLIRNGQAISVKVGAP